MATSEERGEEGVRRNSFDKVRTAWESTGYGITCHVLKMTKSLEK